MSPLVSPRRHLVVVSYYHPPYPSSGGNRWTAMARHLRAEGHRVTIVASDAFGALDGDAERDVVRAHDLKSSPLLRRVLGRGALAETGAGTGATAEPPAPAILTKVLVPDAHLVGWVPSAARVLRRLVAQGDVDCVVTTSPPESAHLVALALGRRRPAWIADLRDGWTFEQLRAPFPTTAQRRLDRAVERRALRTADGVVAVTRSIAGDLRDRLGIPAATITNGYDPALDDDVAAAAVPELPAGRRLVVHTGVMSGLGGRDAGPFLEALARVADDPDVAGRIAFVQVGPLTPEDEARVAPLRARGIAHTVGLVPRATAIAIQRQAAALLLITSSDTGQATGKIYEYLAARRPVIALAEGNDAARIVTETRAGVTVGPYDVGAIAAVLRSVALGADLPAVDEDAASPYLYPGPALAMAELVEDAIARRSAGRRGSA